MCWKKVSRLQKSLHLLLLYLTLYLIMCYVLAPETKISFINEDFRLGEKYVLMFLVAPGTPVFSDIEGADVFTLKQCGKCFITNNIGFLPMSEYDAILVHGDRSLFSDTEAFMDPEKRYLIQAKRRCIYRKFRDCIHEPKVTSYTNREEFDLCGLCKRLQEKKSL